MPEGDVLYTIDEGVCIIKMRGRIRHTIAPAMDTFIARLFSDLGAEDVVVDLTETTYIDSTSLGLLAKIANIVAARAQRKVAIVSSNEDITLVLEGMGFDQAFIIVSKASAERGDLESIPGIREPDRDHAAILLDAHRRLMALNEKNRIQFQSVVSTLERETQDGSRPARSVPQ